MNAFRRPQSSRGSSAADRVSRRHFVRQSLTAASALALPNLILPRAHGAETPAVPAKRVTLGLIGNGRMGGGHLRYLSHRDEAEVVAVCDVDPLRRERAREEVDEINTRLAGPARPFRACAAYADYREILARPDIDAVVIVTPDHWHAPMSIAAAKAGKDVYCEKPVSLTIAEGRELVDTIRRYGRVFQTGTQYRSIPDLRRVCQFIRDGRLGRIKSVFAIYRSIRRLISEERFAPFAGVMSAERVGDAFAPLDFALPAAPVPTGIDWNLWVGPAPWRDYSPLYHDNAVNVVVPWCFADAFGETASTQYFSHSADIIQWALGHETGGPVEILHPSDGGFPTLTCRYADGTLLHLVENWSDVKTLYRAVPDEARLAGLFGGLFVGERGWINAISGGGKIEGGPESLFEEMNYTRRREISPASNTHHANWLECIHTRQQPSSHEEIGHRSASLAHLINIASILGHSLRWDPKLETFPDHPIANRLCRRAARAADWS